MKDFVKNKIVTGVVVITTIILAGVAIFTAIRLYQTGTEPVAPTAPDSEPAAGSLPQACQMLTFSLEEEAPTATPTEAVAATPTITTATSTPTPTEGVGGGDTPTSTPTATPTIAATTSTPTQSPTATPTEAPLGGGEEADPTSTTTAEASPTSEQIAQTSPETGGAGGAADDQLPAAGISMPTILAGVLGILLLMFSIALVF